MPNPTTSTNSPQEKSDAEPTAEDPKWTANEIDRYLLLLAQEAAPSLELAWSAFVAAAERQGAESADIAEQWRSMLAHGPQHFGRGLLDPGKSGRVLRRIAPMFAIVPYERREELLRQATLSGSCGEAYAQRWAGNLGEMNLVDVVVAHLIASTNGDLLDAFTAFVTASGQTKWIITADFVIADDTRPNDVFGFVAIPHDADFDELMREIASVFPKDLKNTKIITPDMIAYLRSKRRFHFAFVVNKDRKIFKNATEARSAIDRTISMMLRYADVELHRESIAKLKALRQRANANNFISKLLAGVILMATFAVFIANLLQTEGRAELIGLFPDRDKMTTAWGTLAYETFAQNASSFALRRNVPESQIALGLPGPRSDGKDGLYFDELIRIPDYVAGAVASTELTPPRPRGVNQKCVDIVAKALVDNDNVAILRLDLPPKTLAANRILLRSTPPDLTAAPALPGSATIAVTDEEGVS